MVAAIERAGVCERKCGRFRFCLLFGLVTGSDVQGPARLETPGLGSA